LSHITYEVDVGLGRGKKRSVQDVPIFLDERFFEELRETVESVNWGYKTNQDLYRLRDRAIVCLLILSGLRVSEAVQLKKLQFRVYKKKIILANVKTLKKGLVRHKIILPKRGRLAWFTQVFEDWLRFVPSDDSYVFPSGNQFGFNWGKPLSRKRVFWIVKTTTHKFPHWFRGVCETIYGRLVFKSDAWKLKEFMGLKRLDSTTPYVKGSWEEDEKEIYKI